MQKTILIIAILMTRNLISAQTIDNMLTVKYINSDLGIKNVNIVIPQLDTILITDAAGIVNLHGLSGMDTLIIKKFGYEKQVVIDNRRHIFLKRDTLVYSHNLKLLDLKHGDGCSYIKLSINGDIYWFKQIIGSLFLGNGREIETGQEYEDIFRNHKIIKTISVASEYCLWRIRGENSAYWITAIYYEPVNKKKISNYIPYTS